MNRYTKKQKETAKKLILGPVMDRDVMPGERRTLESLLLRGMVSKCGEDGRVVWEANSKTVLIPLTTQQYIVVKKMLIDGEINLLKGNTTIGDLRVLYKLENDGLCELEQTLPSETWKNKRYVPTEKLKQAFA